jgi:hypothetical protein
MTEGSEKNLSTAELDGIGVFLYFDTSPPTPAIIPLPILTLPNHWLSVNLSVRGVGGVVPLPLTPNLPPTPNTVGQPSIYICSGYFLGLPYPDPFSVHIRILLSTEMMIAD